MQSVITKSDIHTNILKKFETTRQYSCDLCKPLHNEDYIPQPRDFASPPKWHLAHTTWFFEEMILKKFSTQYQIYNEKYSFLFNSYYNTIGDKAIRAERGAITRPTVDQVYEYRSYVNQHLINLINKAPNNEILELIELGIHHEQQHQELLITDLKHTFSLNPTFPVYKVDNNWVKQENEATGWLEVEEGVYTIGHQNEQFCYDNELGVHKVYIKPFKIAKGLVTNEEFIEFIEDGGYKNFKYWLDEGWNWVQSNLIDRPLYWYKIEGQWYYYTLAGLKPVNGKAIVSHISFYEAQAFAAYKGLRLATEFEWEVAHQNLNIGKRWEWTNSAYLPYPGFKTCKGAVGEYNGKFMINMMVLRGGSVASPPNHVRYTYRNFFHPQYRWQYTGIRLAE